MQVLYFLFKGHIMLMGKYNDISDQLPQYVSRSKTISSVDVTANQSIPGDGRSVTYNQGVEQKEKTSDININKKLNIGQNVYQYVYIAPL